MQVEDVKFGTNTDQLVLVQPAVSLSLQSTSTGFATSTLQLAPFSVSLVHCLFSR